MSEPGEHVLRARLGLYLGSPTPSDIRAHGWRVAVHNDYRQDGRDHTFWLFTKGEQAIKGEGHTDSDALDQVRQRLADLLTPPPRGAS